MLPWIFAYDRMIWSRSLTICLSKMTKLPCNHYNAHLTTHRELLAGEFLAQCSVGKAFAQASTNQSIEQSLSREGKTKGCIVGFCLKPGALQQWMLAAHKRSAVARLWKDFAGVGTSSQIHKTSASSVCLGREDIAVSCSCCNNCWFPVQHCICHCSKSTGGKRMLNNLGDWIVWFQPWSSLWPTV